MACGAPFPLLLRPNALLNRFLTRLLCFPQSVRVLPTSSPLSHRLGLRCLPQATRSLVRRPLGDGLSGKEGGFRCVSLSFLRRLHAVCVEGRHRSSRLLATAAAAPSAGGGRLPRSSAFRKLLECAPFRRRHCTLSFIHSLLAAEPKTRWWQPLPAHPAQPSPASQPAGRLPSAERKS